MLFKYHILGKSRRRRNSKGVRKDQCVVDIKYIYFREKKGGFGVRKGDNIIHMLLPDPSVQNHLLYSKPCLCGSLSHVSTRSLKCPLNKRFLDS